jgi:hypothetical protein
LSLVGFLINKLEVVTKNIEMSNVCYVPLGYHFFTRGQLLKLFSFCMKVFREKGYVFPVLKKDEKIPSYEGAIVFDPEPTC